MKRTTLSVVLLFLSVVSPVQADRPPNVVIIFADDLGYADLGSYGAKDWQTPHLDQIARNGVRFSSFLVSQPVCSASRASLLTGCYANRIGIHGALGPGARHGIAANEVTIAELLKSKNYATGMAGKWHLGHLPPFNPTRHGFDEWYGLPYSNDMWPYHPEAKKGTYPNLPLMIGNRIVEADVTAEIQATLTNRYTKRAVEFIEKNKDQPFFYYLAHSMPHVPIFASERFRGSSKQGLYGDVIQEIDWSVGQIIAALEKHKLTNDTLVIFTSDNGPWLSYGNHAGSALPLREGKGTVFEGGVRVPCVAQWPGKIPAGLKQPAPAMTIDLLPTIALLVGADLPGHAIDGRNIWPLFTGEATSNDRAYCHYYHQGELQAVRKGPWKLMLPHTSRSMEGQEPGHDGRPGRYRPLKVAQALYNLDADIGETRDVQQQHPAIMKQLLAEVERIRADLGDTATKRTGEGLRPPDRMPSPKKQKSQPEFSSELIFPLHNKHNHAPGIVECPNGDLLVSWYRGSGERSADDVAVFGARFPGGKSDAKWSEPFLLADTPGFPDCNTALWIDAKERLWLFWPVILANSWESCLTHYRIANDYQRSGPPQWDWQGTIPLIPKDFEPVMMREFELWKNRLAGIPLPKVLGEDFVKQRVTNKLLSRLGWQPRCKPIALKSGRILLPLYSDTYSAGIMAISDDGGQSWSASTPLAGFGSIQPTLFERADGSVVAYMRENGVFKKIRVAESKDRGLTWSRVGETDLSNPGSGIDGVRLADGRWLLVYNDTTRGRNRLAVAISADEGKTWPWTRHLEDEPTGSYHYPAVIQGRDGAIHAVYSYFVANGKSMKHARFTPDWVTHNKQ